LVYAGTVFALLTSSTAVLFTVAGTLLAARSKQILQINQHGGWPVTFGMKGSSYLCSQITGGTEIAVPLHVDTPCTKGRGSDLPFEVVLQEYFQFSLWIFSFSFCGQGLLLYTLSFRQPQKKKFTRIKIR
jgi:hypothetical protein